MMLQVANQSTQNGWLPNVYFWIFLVWWISDHFWTSWKLLKIMVISGNTVVCSTLMKLQLHSHPNKETLEDGFNLGGRYTMQFSQKQWLSRIGSFVAITIVKLKFYTYILYQTSRRDEMILGYRSKGDPFRVCFWECICFLASSCGQDLFPTKTNIFN